MTPGNMILPKGISCVTLISYHSHMKFLFPALGLALLAGCSPREKTALVVASVPVAGPVHTKGAEPLGIAHGEQVALADYLVTGKTTIFDFTSKYCGPCQAYNEPLAKLHTQRADIAVVKVDINRPETKGIDWKSPVARQYDMNGIPHFKIYGPDGKLIAEGKAGRALVNKFIEELK